MSGTPEFELSFYVAAIPWSVEHGGHYFRPEELRARLNAIKTAGGVAVGIDGVTLTDELARKFAPAIAEVAGLLAETGLRVTSLHYAGPVWAPLETGQAGFAEHFARYTEFFAGWKPRALVVHAGWSAGAAGSGAAQIANYQTQVARHGVEQVAETVAQNLRAFARAAAQQGQRIAVENTGYMFPLGQREELPRLIAAVNEPNLGYCLDSGHAHAFGEDVSEWLRLIGDRLFETHFHDNRGLGRNLPRVLADLAPKIDEHLSPGFGTLPWIDVIQTLRAIRFAGPVTFETAGWPGAELAESYRLAVAYWRTCERLATQKSAG